jgi:hypothetical protein
MSVLLEYDAMSLGMNFYVYIYIYIFTCQAFEGNTHSVEMLLAQQYNVMSQNTYILRNTPVKMSHLTEQKWLLCTLPVV